MTPLKVAILEDNKSFLKEMIDNLKRTELVKIVVAEQYAEQFIEKVREQKPEALLLDILLNGESITGIQVAEILKLPVMFLSAARKDFLDGIQNLKLLGTFPVEEINKIPDSEKLKTILNSFIPRVREYQKSHQTLIKPKGEDEIPIYTSDVSFIETVKGTGNHKLRFHSRKSIETADTTFEYFRSIGFSEEKFYRLGKSYLVNISAGVFENGKINVQFKTDNGTTDTARLEVPDDKRKEVKKLFLK